MDFGKVTEKTPLFNEDGDNPVNDENDEEIGMVNLNRDTSTSSVSFNPKGLNKTYEETSFGGEPSGTTSLDEREKNVDDTLHKIKIRFPKFNPAKSSFTFGLDGKDQVIVRLNRVNGDYHSLFDENGELNTKLPKTIIKSLGPSAEKIFETNKEEIARRNKKNK